MSRKIRKIGNNETSFQVGPAILILTTVTGPRNGSCSHRRHSEGAELGRVDDAGDGLVLDVWNDIGTCVAALRRDQ